MDATLHTLRDLFRAADHTPTTAAPLLGVSRQAVSQWLSGRSTPRVAHVRAMARLLGVQAADVLSASEASILARSSDRS